LISKLTEHGMDDYRFPGWAELFSRLLMVRSALRPNQTQQIPLEVKWQKWEA